ncbi:hypothetical protein BU15DRAFT_73818, partial [Melanogaster broomeanus]
IKDGLAVIPVSEDSKTLDTLLRFCYPCTLAEDPNLEQLKDVTDVLEAAKKYSIGAIERKVAQALSNPKILEVDPLRCFAIAHHGQLRDETLLAAKYTLRQPLIPSWFEEIELLSATDLLALLTYHQKCGTAVYALKTDMSGREDVWSWLTDRQNTPCECPNSPVCTYNMFGTPVNQRPQWWDDFMEETFRVLRDKPCEATIQACAEQTVQSVRAKNCAACSPRVGEGMRQFSALFAQKVEGVVSQVELELKF